MLFELIAGIALLTFAIPITNFLDKHQPSTLLKKTSRLHILWMIRCLGLFLLYIAADSGSYRPNPNLMKKEENMIILLEEGKIAEGEVIKLFYDKKANINAFFYKFITDDPETGQLKVFWSTSNPYNYLESQLQVGDNIEIIYHPSKPEISMEIKDFLSNKWHLRVFSENNKLDLLQRFRDKYPIEDY